MMVSFALLKTHPMAQQALQETSASVQDSLAFISADKVTYMKQIGKNLSLKALKALTWKIWGNKWVCLNFVRDDFVDVLFFVPESFSFQSLIFRIDWICTLVIYLLFDLFWNIPISTKSHTFLRTLKISPWTSEQSEIEIGFRSSFYTLLSDLRLSFVSSTWTSFLSSRDLDAPCSWGWLSSSRLVEGFWRDESMIVRARTLGQFQEEIAARWLSR